MRAVALALALALAACGGAPAGPRVHRVAYPGGMARLEFTLRDGRPNGPGRAWHPNGALAHEGSYADGARQGRFWFYTDTGAFAYQAMFLDNTEVWRSDVATAEPPIEWSRELPSTPAPALVRATVVEAGPLPPWITQSRAPVPSFSTLDRITGPARAGVQLGVGSAPGLELGAVSRLDVFGHYRTGRVGVHGQLSGTLVQLPGAMRLTGRQTLEAGGSYRREVRTLDTLTGRAGLLVPVAQDDTRGFIASTAGAAQRASDAATAFPSSIAVRTSTSLTRVRDRVVLQADLGVDWLLGGEDGAFDALVRAGGGVGFGSRRALLTFEASSAVRASDPGRRIIAAAVGRTLAFARVWVTAGVSITQDGTPAILTTVGHDL